MLHVRVRAALTASSLASVTALSLVGCSLAGGGGDGSTATEPSTSSSGAEQGGGTVAGLAMLLELSFLPGRAKVGDLPLTVLHTV